MSRYLHLRDMAVAVCGIAIAVAATAAIFAIDATGSIDDRRTIVLAEAIELALANGTDLDLLAARLSQTQLFVDTRRLLPSLRIDYSAGDRVIYNELDSHSRRLAFSIRQPIGGERLDVYRRHRAELGLVRLQDDQRRRTLIGQVIILYVGAIQARMQSAIMVETLSAGQRQLEVTQLELENGGITRNDFLDRVLAVKNIELDHAQALHNEWLARQRLGLLVGGGRLEQVATVGEINLNYNGVLNDVAIEELLARAEQENVELAGRRLESRFAGSDLDRIGRFWLPDVTASLEFALQGDRFSLDSPEITVGFDLRFPLPGLPITGSIRFAALPPNQRSIEQQLSVAPFDGLERLVLQQEAQLEFARAQNAVTETRRQLERELQERVRTIEARRQRLALLRETLQLTGDRMRTREVAAGVGEATGLALLRDRIAMARLRIEIVDAVVGLFREEQELASLYSVSSRPIGYEELIKKGEEQ